MVLLKNLLNARMYGKSYKWFFYNMIGSEVTTILVWLILALASKLGKGLLPSGRFCQVNSNVEGIS